MNAEYFIEWFTASNCLQLQGAKSPALEGGWGGGQNRHTITQTVAELLQLTRIYNSHSRKYELDNIERSYSLRNVRIFPYLTILLKSYGPK
jgi:hypothetical protein